MTTQQAEQVSSVISLEQNESIEFQATPNSSDSSGDSKIESFGTMAELKEKAPEVYRVMMQGIGMTICREMQKHQKHLKEIKRKARENQG